MRQDDRAAAERLSAAWDSSLAETPETFHGLETDLVERVRALHVFAAPPPNPEFVARLATSFRDRAGRTQTPTASYMHVLPANRTWATRAPWVPRSAAAAAVFLTLLAGLFALSSHYDADEPEPVQLAAVSAATPLATTFTVSAPSPGERPDDPITFDQCLVQPLPEAVVEEASPWVSTASPEITFDAQRDAVGDIREAPVVQGLPDGPEASATQLAGIGATVRELSACRFYDSAESGPDGRLFALFTERFRSELPRSPRGDLARPWRLNPVQPASIQLTRQLSDGRVLAVLVNELSYAPGVFEIFVAAFVLRGDRWLVDETLATSFWENAETQWEQERGVVELVFTEQDPGYQPIHGSQVLMDGWTYSLVLYNPGATERRFVSRDLGLDVTVPPYETRSVEFIPSTGEYTFETHTDGKVDEAAPPPCDGMPYPENIMIVYAEPPLNDRWSCGMG